MILQEILDYLDICKVDYTFIGNSRTNVSGFSSLFNYKEGTITWIKTSDAYAKAGNPCNITCAIVQKGTEVCFENAIYVEVSKGIFFDILRKFWEHKMIQSERIGKGTVISEEVKLDSSVVIGCNCSLVGSITIGKGTVIEHNVVIQGNVKIGTNCYIQSGVIIGIDGYGYAQDIDNKKKEMIDHFGGVTIGDDVFIGSHTNIARGTIDDTVIGNGVKIAPSTHIGHNNNIGEDSAIICSVLYGSVKVGERSYITDSTIANQSAVGRDTVIGMGSVVTKTIGNGVIAYGTPAVVKRMNDSCL